MQAIVVQFTFGIVVFDEKHNFNDIILYKKDPELAAETIINNENGKLSPEVESLIRLMQSKNFDEFLFENNNMAKAIQKTMNIAIELAPSSEFRDLHSKMEQIAIESGFIKTSEELVLWNRNVSMAIAKLKIKTSSEHRDLIIAQAIQTLDDLDRTVNLFMSRLREWYGVHFPELDRLVDKHETYARLIELIGDRENFSISNLKETSMQEERATKLSQAATNSMGAELKVVDLNQIRILSKDVLSLYELRKGMEKYVDATMESVAPNTRAVAGALLGARLISIAGSLRNLAMRPASTIQVLGAEKALFRSLKTGARPPKHGLIFQHALLHDAKRWQRGKIARALAGKIAIAVRTDSFNGKFVGDSLKRAVEKRLEEIKRKYKDPPPPKERTVKPERSRSSFRQRRPPFNKNKWRKNRRARTS